MPYPLYPDARMLVYALPPSTPRTRPYVVVDAPARMPESRSGGDGEQAKVVPRQVMRVGIVDEPTGTRTAGYTLEPSLSARNCYIQGTNITLPTDFEGLAFSARGDSWATVVPDYEPRTSAIKWYSANAETKYSARTVQELPQAQSFALQLQAFGYAGDNAYLAIQWGKAYRIHIKANGEAALERKHRAIPWQWVKLRDIPIPAEQFAGEEPTWIWVRHIAGRIVLDLSQGKIRHRVTYGALTEKGNPEAPDRDELRVDDLLPEAAPLIVQGQGVPFTLRAHELRYAQDGSIDRDFRQQDGTGAPTAEAFGHHPLTAERVGGQGTVASVTVQQLTNDQRRYTCSLKRNQTGKPGQAMQGHVTPWVHGVTVAYDGNLPDYTQDALDIRPALSELTLEHGDPGLMPGATMTAKIDTRALPSCRIIGPNGEDKGAVGDNWRQYLERYHFARFKAWQHWSDGFVGVRSRSGELGADYELFQGYVWSLNPEMEGYEEEHLTVEFRDPIVRLQRPAGIIDSRFAPADALLMRKVRNGGAPRLEGWELVEYILKQSLGEAWAHRLRVGLWQTRYDLINYTLLMSPPMGGGFLFPPPFGQSALDWIKQIAEIDFAIFCFRNGRTGPYPYYGSYYLTGLHQESYTISDSDVVPASKAGWRQDPSQDFNVVQVWGRIPGDSGDYGGIMPAMPQLSATAWVNSSIPEQDPRRTWERTLLKQGTHFYRPHIARFVASMIATGLSNKEIRNVSFTLAHGDPYFDWGQNVVVNFTAPGSSNDLFTPGEEFRVMRLSHRFVFGQQPTWTTNLTCAESMSMR